MRRLATLAGVFLALVLPASALAAAGAAFPPGFPTIVDASLGVPVIGFGGAGLVERTPVILLHGNNDTPFPTACNPFGDVQALADHFLANGYRPSEVWALGYQGDQCDLLADQTRRSAFAHSTVANVPDLRAFVRAVLRYTGAKASRHRRPQPRRDARARMDAPGPRVPPRRATSSRSTARTTGSSTARRTR